MFLFCLVFAMFCARLFICALWSPAGKGLTSWLSFVVSSVSLSLSHWYPGSGVVLDCIDSWSLQPYYFHWVSYSVQVLKLTLGFMFWIFPETCTGYHILFISWDLHWVSYSVLFLKLAQGFIFCTFPVSYSCTGFILFTIPEICTGYNIL